MYRFYETIPGMLAWGTIVLLFIFSWIFPEAMAIFIILFDIYWLLKTIFLSMHLRATFSEMRKNLKIDWLGELANLHETGHESHESEKSISEINDQISDYSRIYHLVILPMYNEPYEVIRESMQSLANAAYPKDKFIVVLASEERGYKNTKGSIAKIEKEFKSAFFKFLITVHPADLPGEIPGKGSNETWAAKEVRRSVIDPLQIPYDNILASVFDVDTQVPPGYFARLTYVFLTSPHRERSSFQPIPFFTNNIYEAPALGRVISFSATFWHMMQQSRPERLTTFSSHSMPFKALVEIGFWQTNIVSEDSRIFWQCYLHYGGNWRVVPLHYPVMMDANVAPTFWGTLLNLYKQQRRWGWGCENIPYILNGFRKNKQIPFRKKCYWSFTIIEGFHSWATNALIIFALGWLPILLGGSSFHLTVLSYNLPIITRWIMTFAMVGIVTSAVLSIALLPPKPKWFRPWHYPLYFVQWALMPITLIIFGAFPGLEAQTRLMLGGRFRLGFWVTPKQRLVASSKQ